MREKLPRMLFGRMKARKMRGNEQIERQAMEMDIRVSQTGCGLCLFERDRIFMKANFYESKSLYFLVL